MRMHTDNCPRRSCGFCLVEMMVGFTVSLIVTMTMITLVTGLMSNASRIILMTKLSDDLRVSMQMMSRDVRRSNYTADAIYCYANPDCFEDGSLAAPGDVRISQNGDCMVFYLDRDHDGDSTENAAGGFRRTLTGDVGVIQMWVGDTQPDCNSNDTAWVAVTDPADFEITAFSVEDELSHSEVIWVDHEGNQTFQKVRKLRIRLSGRLINDSSIHRSVEDVIKLRNNLYL